MSVALNEVLTISPAGRASREAYWLSLFAALVFFGLALVVLGFSPAWSALFGMSSEPVAEPTAIATSFLGGVLLLFSIVYLASAVVRRLHDMAASGWAALFLLIPVVNIAVLIAIGFPRGTSMNRFGPDPLTIRTVDRRTLEKTRRAHEAAEDAEDAVPVEAQMRGEEVVPAVEAQSSTDAERSAPQAQDSPASALYELARLNCMNESDSIRLQVKVRSVEKLRKLLKKGQITQAQFQFWQRRIMAL